MTCDASTQVACYRKGQLKHCRPRLSLPSRFLPLPPQQATVIPPSLAAADSSSSVYNHTGPDTYAHSEIRCRSIISFRWYQCSLRSTGAGIASRSGNRSALFQPRTQGLARNSMTPFDPTQARPFLIGFQNTFLLFFRIALPRLKHAIGATGLAMILLVATCIGSIFGELFAVTFAAPMYFGFNDHNLNPLVKFVSNHYTPALKNSPLPFFDSRSPFLSRRVSQKTVAGSAAFQAAGVAEAPFRGYRLTLPPAGTRGNRQDTGAPRGLGRGDQKARSVPFAVPSEKAEAKPPALAASMRPGHRARG